MTPVLIIVGVIALIGLLIFFAWKYEKKRTAEMEAIAAEMGLDFRPEGDAGVASMLQSLSLFNHGRSRRFKNMIVGETNNVSIAIFSYQYTTGSGKNQTTHVQTVISFQSSHLSLPNFELRPENMFHKIGQAFGYGDIDFDTHPIFSKKFLLRGPDELSIRDLFSPEILSHFEENQGVCVEAGQQQLIFYRTRTRVKPQKIRDFMAEGFGVYGLFKNE